MAPMMKMQQGQNSPFNSTTLVIEVVSGNPSDRLFVVEEKSSGNDIKQVSKNANGRFTKTIDLLKTSESTEKFKIVAATEANSNEPLDYLECQVECGSEHFSMLPVISDKGFCASVIGEVYRRNGAWKLRFLGDGFKSFEAASKALGIEIKAMQSQPQGSVISNPESDKSRAPEQHQHSSESSAMPASEMNSTLKDSLTRGRNMFDKIKQTLRAKTDELATEVKKFKNKEFLNAAMAGSVLVAVADGSVSSEEKQKMIRFIKANKALQVFDSKKVIETFNQYLDVVEFDMDAGRAECFDAIAKLKGKEDQARLVVRMVIAIGESDGDFDQDERRVVEEISKEMNVSFQ